MRKINVVHIIKSLHLGGAENVVYTLVKNIDGSKFNVIICCLDNEGYLAEKLKEEGFIVFCLRERFRYRWRQMLNLYRLLKREQIDIVHTHLFKSDFWGRLIALISGVNVICKSEHTVQHPMKFGIWSLVRPPFYNVMKIIGMNFFLDNRTKAILYDTMYARESFVGNNYNENKHIVVYLGLDKDRMNVPFDSKKIRAKLRFNNDDFILIIVARLVERKGHVFLFKAFTRLSIQYPRMKLVVAGDGPLRGDLIKMVRTLNIENRTIFLGNVENAPELIKMSNVFILPAWREALGLVLLEAMYLGVPVIGADEAGIPEVIENNVSGYLIKVRDSESIEKALLRVINEPEKTKQMIENAKVKVERDFSEEVFTRKYEDIYHSLNKKYVYLNN